MSSPAPSVWPNLRGILLRRTGILTASSKGQAVAAWATWAVLSLAGLWFVAAYGLTMPYFDEWAWVPVVTGQEPASLQWLWSQHNEHRMVLPRLIYLGLGKLSGFSFRAGSFFNVLALSGLAMALMLAARRLRGRTSLCDAFFPLALLHWGHITNLVWGFQLNFVTATVLAGIILIRVARCGRQLSLASAVLVTGCLVGLGLCGTFGLAYLPAMACWLGFAAISRWRDGGPHAARRALAMGALAAMPVALVTVYFLGFTRPENHAASPGILASLRTGLEFLSSGIGLAAKEVWPASALLVAAGGALGVWQLCHAFRDRPQDRVRAAGFFCFFAGVGALAMGIGWGRAFLGPGAGFTPRYVTLAAILFCLVYLLSEACGTAALGRHVRRSLFVLMCLLLAVNARKGLRYAAELRADLAGFREDALAGMPARCLAARYGEQLGCGPERVLAVYLQRLRERGLGLYRGRTESDRLDALRVARIGFTPGQPSCRLTGGSRGAPPAR